MTNLTHGTWSGSLRRSAGVLTPLFSIYSQNSLGVGEYPDLGLLADWCGKTGLNVIQLLPLNDIGFNFRPYDAESSFALEPMHLCLEKIAHADTGVFKKEIAALRKNFPPNKEFFDTGIKKVKLAILKKMFAKRAPGGDRPFKKFITEWESWLLPYAQFKVLKERFALAGWMDWPEEFKRREPKALARLEKEAPDSLLFYQWIQWQAFLQLREAKKRLEKKGVQLVGDIPFLVSRDSADVWANPQYFKLELSAGAPPDLYFADGQEWGMPPYDWQAIERDQFSYIRQKLKYAENFYDYFRVDHFVGVFRVWTFRYGLPHGERRATGAFDPPDEKIWEEHGRKIVRAMVKSTRMRPLAEDLGCVPECSGRVLQDFEIPGMDVQRWMRHWETTGEFKKPSEYRVNAVAVISTHDTAPLLAWWKGEAGNEEDRQKFWKSIGLEGPCQAEPSSLFVEACFRAVSATASVFSIQLFQDWLAFAGLLKEASPDDRINKPGTMDDKNWRLRLPFSLEELKNRPENKKIFSLNKAAGRIH